MKILAYGAGVIGSPYAAKLQDSGHPVTVLARGERLNDPWRSSSRPWRGRESGGAPLLKSLAVLRDLNHRRAEGFNHAEPAACAKAAHPA